MINYNFNLEPTEAIKYLENKGFKLSFNYNELQKEAHHRAFSVAKVTRLDLLKDIFDALGKAQKEGKSFESFKKELIPTLKSYGWWGETDVTDPKTGEVKTIEVNSNRLKTIFETNMRVASNNARCKAQRLLSDSVYWRYISVLDSRTRANHRAMNGIILHRDNPFWKKNYPPNGWRCRCRVRAYSKAQIEANGWSITTATLTNIAQDDFAYNMCGDEHLEKIFKDKIDKINNPKLREVALSDYQKVVTKEMPKELKDLTSDERRFIMSWVDNASTIIQAVILKNFTDLTKEEAKYQDKAKTLLNMFDKYKSSYPKNLPIYRGLIFNNKKLFELVKLRFIKYHNSNKAIVIDKKPISFSKDKDIAQEFANGEYGVILTLQTRKTDDLDIEKVSPSDREREIIVKHNLKYKVIDYKEKDNFIEVTLEEIK